jgi:NTP pyrophosphatase (non-canonical NTP hydrolase)
LSPEEKKEFAKELGDALWYIAASARELGFDLSEIAVQNIAKLSDRRNRGVIKSAGDNR